MKKGHVSDPITITLVNIKNSLRIDETDNEGNSRLSRLFLAATGSAKNNKSNSMASAVQVETNLRKQLRDHLQFRKLKCIFAMMQLDSI